VILFAFLCKRESAASGARSRAAVDSGSRTAAANRAALPLSMRTNVTRRSSACLLWVASVHPGGIRAARGQG
jgi:hypothetical protein